MPATPRKVWLTRDEMAVASISGSARHHDTVSDGYQNANGLDSGAEAHIIGAYGEVAVCKLLNIYYTPKGEKGGPDAGGIFQVRTSKENHWPSMILRTGDRKNHPDDPFVCVSGHAPFMTVWGWVVPRPFFTDEYQHAWPPSTVKSHWRVPKTELIDIDELPPGLRLGKGDHS